MMKLKYALEELRFVKSLQDLVFFFNKVGYLLPRITGNLERYSKIPPSLQIEPTNFCNIQCICCSTARSTRPRGYMDFGLFQKIIDEASDGGVKRVHLYLHGEPLLHPKILDMVTYIKTKGMAINLTTNGIYLNNEKSIQLLHSGVNSADYFMFSVLGFSKEIHEYIMRGIKHDIIINNILNFLELRKGLKINGPIVETMFYIMPKNEHEIKHYEDFWHGKVDHARVVGRISQSFSEYKKEEKAVLSRTKTCPMLWERMTIFWNGDVSLCSQDVDGDWVLGNLRKQSIFEIWNSEKMLSIKRIHMEKRFRDFQFCLSCDM